jgi:hypothetical protein
MLKIALLTDHEGPDDYVVVFQDRQWTCDSYWFWMDPALPQDMSLTQALQLLLTQWRTIVAGTTAGTRYLPFELHDQSTRWLRCTVQDADVTLDVGWSRLEGHRVRLADIPAASALVAHFQAETPAGTLPKAVLLDQLTALIESFAREQQDAADAPSQ